MPEAGNFNPSSKHMIRRETQEETQKAEQKLHCAYDFAETRLTVCRSVYLPSILIILVNHNLLCKELWLNLGQSTK